jgi:hypothetical protein
MQRAVLVRVFDWGGFGMPSVYRLQAGDSPAKSKTLSERILSLLLSLGIEGGGLKSASEDKNEKNTGYSGGVSPYLLEV